ncbi:low choriolytic enzyme-like [Elysia marginata]|uniref:Low choriolytic enzyme-like n=1 Tax=Elysia marginata TaxID=1093978 RepID=A0AAV4GHX7_9GAST|nr:low choriolytic enzyme-like [Elysia marginata]
MVWSDASRLGCYSTRCASLRNTESTNAWFFVCFYYPRGNRPGMPPYHTTCDLEAPCDSVGGVEEDGLCVPKPRCYSRYFSCEYLVSMGECGHNLGFMMKYCACHCIDTSAAALSWLQPGPGGDNATAAGGTCKDDLPECLAWAAIAHCRRFSRYTSMHCSRSCGHCRVDQDMSQVSASCLDSFPACPALAARGKCRTDPRDTLPACLRSCGACLGDGACHDLRSDCSDLAQIGYCARNPGFMLFDCQKSCGVC